MQALVSTHYSKWIDGSLGWIKEENVCEKAKFLNNLPWEFVLVLDQLKNIGIQQINGVYKVSNNGELFDDTSAWDEIEKETGAKSFSTAYAKEAVELLKNQRLLKQMPLKAIAQAQEIFLIGCNFSSCVLQSFLHLAIIAHAMHKHKKIILPLEFIHERNFGWLSSSCEAYYYQFNEFSDYWMHLKQMQIPFTAQIYFDKQTQEAITQKIMRENPFNFLAMLESQFPVKNGILSISNFGEQPMLQIDVCYSLQDYLERQAECKTE